MKRKNISLVLIPFALAAACGGAGGPAQPAPRALPSLEQPGDSAAWFEEITTIISSVREGDTVQVNRRFAAVPHLVRLSPDTLRGYYEVMLVRLDSPQGIVSPDTDPLLHEPFLLVETDHGIETVAAPEVDRLVYWLMDVRVHFEDMFPEGFDLGIAHDVGDTWTDTVQVTRAPANVPETSRTSITHYRVVGDTVYEAIPGLVVEYSSEVRMTSLTATPVQGEVETSFEGTADGTFIYAPSRHLLLEWVREGALAGESRALEHPDAPVLPQIYEYAGRTRLVTPDAES